ncbi:BrxA family protein [Nonomuraea wenchangensis]|uniref:Putative inner membrane protein n=1 Tax=Nonomuraea wenchangensis TaxID=568860 RepID=A0A1I0LXQ0_9ACTN|nr:BrxA family protein [Nonomuraea wenchangensis]SEU47591.1 Putative inner membrane protein [Nonomuraea wenchangensis]
MAESRSSVVSSFTIIKGSLIDETYAVFREWDFDKSRTENLIRVREENTIGAKSTHWARDVAKVISRRFDPAGRDRPLVDLAIAGCARDVWKPLLLFHLTRDEFLVRDFLVHWLYPQFVQGAFRLHTDDVVTYLTMLSKNKGIEWSGKWTESTILRVASGLLRMATDFGLLSGTVHKEFASYHLSEASFVYLLHAMAEVEPNARRIIEADDWHMYLMDISDVERELLRLHQFRKVHYEVAGSLAQLKLPCGSPGEYAKELCA